MHLVRSEYAVGLNYFFRADWPCSLLILAATLRLSIGGGEGIYHFRRLENETPVGSRSEPVGLLVHHFFAWEILLLLWVYFVYCARC